MWTRCLATLRILFFVVAAGSLQGEEPGVRIQIDALLDDPLPPDVKMRIMDYNIDDGAAASDTSRRSYSLLCSERHAEKRKEPKKLVEFEFTIDDKKAKSNSPKQSLVNRLGASLRRGI